MTDPMNDPAGPRSGTASALMRRFPPFARGGAVRVFVAILGVLLVVSFGVPVATRGVIDARQRTLPENYVRRAIEALEAGKAADDLGDGGPDRDEEARKYVALALDTTIHRTRQGRALHNLVLLYTDLAGLLEARGWTSDARAMAWKAIRHDQRSGRPLLDLGPWRVLQRSYLKDDPARFAQVFEILCAQSVRKNKEFLDSIFKTHPAYVDYAALRNAYHNFYHRRFSRLVKTSPLIEDNPELDVAARIMTARIYMSGGRRQKSKAIVESLTRDYPHRLDTQALAAQNRNGVDIGWFVSRLMIGRQKSEWHVLDFSGMKPAPSEHNEPPRIREYKPGIAGMFVRGSGEMEFDAPVAAGGFYIEASGSEYLDMFPIATIQIDGGELYPMHFDSQPRELFHVALPLEAGRHTLRVQFLNDYGGTLMDKSFNRNLLLRHLILPARAR